MDVSQRYDPPDDLIAIIDMEGVQNFPIHFAIFNFSTFQLSLMHLTRLKPHIVKSFVDFLQDGMALKIKNIHVLNTHYVAKKFVAVLKLFMKKALADTVSDK